MSSIISAEIQEYRLKIEEIVKDLHQMTIDIGHEELSQTVSDLRNRIQEPFMFVIVGEVKAGKSSFINALLESKEEICKVAPDPCTDTIQQILYGETEQRIVINEHLHKILMPIDILNEIAIVDTPGTNTISQHHQEITERFVPASDLIVFVFEAKNPYRQSAWDFFDYIHSDWRKKIIFVLQQSDLMEPDDLKVNIEGVKSYAAKKGIEQPLVFALSAKMEQAGNAESGFLPLREHITKNITGGKAPFLKLQNNIEISHNINERIKSGLDTRSAQYKADVEFRQDITGTLNDQEKRSSYQVDTLVENLLAGYDRITNKTEAELSEGLSFFTLVRRSFMSIFSKKESAQIWLSELSTNMEHDLNKVLSEKLNDGVDDIAESIQQMAKMIDLKIQNSKSILKNNHEIFGDIADRRSNVLRDLQEQFSKFLNREESFWDADLLPGESDFSPNIATGSGLAVIGVVLATVTKGMVMDITGGILTAVGLVFAGVTVGLKRNKILQSYREEIAKGRDGLESEISSKLKNYINKIKKRIDSNFSDFDAMLEVEQKQIEKIGEKHEQIENRLSEINVELPKE